MKPARCAICGLSAIDESSKNKGDWVSFLNTSKEESEFITHPKGLEYFCASHIDQAKKLCQLSSDEAIEKLKLIFHEEGKSKSINIHKKENLFSEFFINTKRKFLNN